MSPFVVPVAIALIAASAWGLRHARLRRTAPFRRLSRRADRAAAQLRAVSASGFETVPLLGSGEARFLPLIEAATAEFGPGHRVMAQTSLGELLCPTGGPDAEAAYAAICTKRLDFTIVDPRGMLVAAIECAPTGRSGAATGLRDAIKREALKKAGVPVIELPHDANPGHVRSRIAAILAPMAPPRSAPQDAPAVPSE